MLKIIVLIPLASWYTEKFCSWRIIEKFEKWGYAKIRKILPNSIVNILFIERWSQTIDFIVQFGKIYRLFRIFAVSELFGNSSRTFFSVYGTRCAPFYRQSSACAVLVRIYYFFTFFRTIAFCKQFFSIFLVMRAAILLFFCTLFLA